MSIQKIALTALALGVAGGFLVGYLSWSPGEDNSGLRTVLLIVAAIGLVLMAAAILVSRRRR